MAALYEITVKALVVKDRKVLLLKRPSYSGGAFWDAPGGRIEDEESFEDSLARELPEEIGYSGEFSIGQLLGCQQWAPPDFHGPPKILLFFAVNAAIDELRLSDEHVGFAWIGAEELPFCGAECRMEPELAEAVERAVAL